VLERIPRGRACDWSREVFPRMLAEGRPLFGQVLDGYWCDVGSIDEYRRGQWDALKGTVRVGLPAVAVSAGVWFGADAWVAPGAVIQGPVLLGAGCRIERDAWVLPGSVIGDRTVVRAGACVGGAVVGQGCRIGRGAVVRDCVLDDGVWVGAAGSVSEGAVVGRGCRLGAGARVGDGQRVEPAQRLAAAAAPITAAFQTPEVPQPARPGARSHRGGTAPVLAP
jgi:mannose-1-phosphate guanylyltransferase/phosphomannomutase